MENIEKTKEQLITELEKLQLQFDELRASTNRSVENGSLFNIKDSCLRLMQVIIAVTSDETIEIEDAFKSILNEICHYIGWPIGHVYITSRNDPDLLEPTEYWHLENAKQFTEFCNVTAVTKFARGIGLPGRVLSSGKPCFIKDVTKDNNFPRGGIAKDMGIKSGFAFPVYVGTKIVAVLEHFTIEEVEFDKRFMKVLVYLGAQIGRIYERKQIRNGVNEVEERYQAVFEQATDSLAIIDGNTGEIVEFNQHAHENLGYTREEFKKLKILDIEVIESPDDITKHIEKIMREGVDIFETMHKTKDGKIRDMRIIAKVMSIPGKTLISSVWRDITEIKEASKAIQESEQRFRQLAENIPEVFWITSHDFSRMIYVSSAYETIWGRTCKSLYEQPRSWMDSIHPDDRKIVVDAIEKHVQGKKELTGEYRIVRSDGSIRWIFDRAFSIRTHSGETSHIIGIAQDITERKRADEELKELNKSLEQRVVKRTEELTSLNTLLLAEIKERKHIAEALLETKRTLAMAQQIAHLGYWDWNIIDKTVIWSDEQFRIFGYEPGEIESTSENFIETLDPHDRERVISAIEKALEGFAPYEIEFKIIRPDGTERNVLTLGEVFRDASGKPVRMIGAVLDITERKQAEKLIKSSRDYLQKLNDSLGAVIFTVKIPERVVEYVNSTVESVFGYKPDECIGKETTIFYPEEEEYHGFGRSLEMAMKEGKNELKQEKLFKRKNGEIFPCEVTTTFLTENEKIVRVISILHDVTERKRMEEELTKVQRLESLGILAGGIAHDFNNSLQGILSTITLAKTYANPKDEIYEKLEEAEKTVLQSRNLPKQLLTFSRGGEPVRQIISLSILIVNSTKIALSGSNVKCELGIPVDLWPVEVDSGQINQVMNNIIINSVQSMSEGGKINVCAENANISLKDSLPLQEGRYVKITIEDQGTGIPQEHLERIFDPYFTTKEKGSGLGLTISYSIIKKHDGYITVDTETGVGTAFYIYLPASQKEDLVEPVQREAEGVSPEPVEETGKRKILIMDDEAIISLAVAHNLKKLKYEVRTARDGAEAIELYKTAMESGEHFDAVVMDLTIPGGMGGEEAIKKLLEIDPEVRAIVASGYSNDPVMSGFKEYGFSEVIEKPYEISELIEKLNRVMMGYK